VSYGRLRPSRVVGQSVGRYRGGVGRTRKPGPTTSDLQPAGVVAPRPAPRQSALDEQTV